MPTTPSSAHDMGPDGLNNWVARHHAGADPIRRRSRHRFRSPRGHRSGSDGSTVSRNLLTSTIAGGLGPAKPRGIGWEGVGASVVASQSRRTNHREEIATFSLNLPPGLCGRIHISHCVCGVRRCGGGVVDKRQQLVVVNNPGIGHVHDVLGMHLEASGKQIA
jgi:hypothetical protein